MKSIKASLDGSPELKQVPHRDRKRKFDDVFQKQRSKTHSNTRASAQRIIDDRLRAMESKLVEYINKSATTLNGKTSTPQSAPE